MSGKYTVNETYVLIHQFLLLLNFNFRFKDNFRCKMEKVNFIEKLAVKVGVSERTVQVLCVKILYKVNSGWRVSNLFNLITLG